MTEYKKMACTNQLCSQDPPDENLCVWGKGDERSLKFILALIPKVVLVIHFNRSLLLCGWGLSKSSLFSDLLTLTHKSFLMMKL